MGVDVVRVSRSGEGRTLLALRGVSPSRLCSPAHAQPAAASSVANILTCACAHAPSLLPLLPVVCERSFRWWPCLFRLQIIPACWLPVFTPISRFLSASHCARVCTRAPAFLSALSRARPTHASPHHSSLPVPATSHISSAAKVASPPFPPPSCPLLPLPPYFLLLRGGLGLQRIAEGGGEGASSTLTSTLPTPRPLGTPPHTSRSSSRQIHWFRPSPSYRQRVDHLSSPQ